MSVYPYKTDDGRTIKSLSEESAEYYNDPYGWVLWAFQWNKGGLEGFDGPDEWAKDYLIRLGEEVAKRGFDGINAVPAIRMATTSGHGIGKAQPLSLLIDTPSGKKAWGEIKVGDKLFGKNGTTKVIARHERGTLPVYQVSFDDGSSTLCCGDHVWNVRGRNQRRTGSNEFIQKTTSELIACGVKRRNGVSDAAQWELPTIDAVEYPKRKLPIHPYTLGVWLGDGGRNTGRITSNDRETLSHLTDVGERVVKNKQKYTYCILDLMVKLRDLGILKNYSYQKSVPDIYKHAPSDVRAEVLRGLMDTDGEATNTAGTSIFSSTSLKLAEDVQWLVRSLGGKAQFQPTTRTPSFKDKDGKKKDGLPCHRISIRMPDGFKLFYITRKQERIKSAQHRYLARWITDIKLVGEEPVMCVTVDAEDSIYLTNDFIPTHNSAMTAWLILWIMSTRPHCKGIVTANTSAQLESKTWAELSKWHSMCITKDWFTINSGKGALRMYHNDFSETWRVDAQTCKEENSESFAGLHAANSTPFYIFDESSAIPDIIWKVAEGGLTDGEPMFFSFGNPTRNSGAFSECFTTMKHRWICRAVDSRTVKITNKVQIEEWKEDYGEDSDFFRVRVRGVFPRAGNSQFISVDLVAAAKARAPYYDFNDPCVISCDVARFGSDDTIIVVRRGRDARSVPWVKLHGCDTMQVAQRIIDLAAVHKPDAIMVDGGGVGGGVVDRLRMLKQPVLEVQFGANADADSSMVDGAVRYYNKRAEIYGRMREWLAGGSIPDDPDLVKELTGVEYGYAMKDGHDCILLEKKADMKKRLGVSPDRADALAISFAFNVVPSDHYEAFNSRRRVSNFTADYNPLDDKYILVN